MRIALCYRCDDRDAGDVYARVAPSGLLCLHGVLRRAGVDSRLFNFRGRPWREVEAALAAFAPRLVGISHFTYNHAAAVRLARTARRAAPGTIVVAGGAQATFLDEALLRSADAPDVCVRGEGEGPLLALAEALRAGEDRRAAIAGLSYRTEGGAIARTPDAPLAPDLDALYPPERFDAVEGVDPRTQFPFIVTSRGCPADCSFCCSPRFWRRKLRFRSAARVADEIEFLHRRFGIDYFSVRDDTFTARKERVREFCAELERRRLFLLWNCQSRVNFVDEERLVWMRRAGCEQVQFGVEAASEPVLARLNKQIHLPQVDSALAACRRVGLRAGAYFITGVPGQGEADIAANLDLVERAGLADVVVAPLAYYPGTALADAAERAGRLDPAVFLSGRAERLLVRADDDARTQFEAMEAAAERSPDEPFDRGELERQLELVGPCHAALLALGRRLEREGDVGRARDLYREVAERWPESPWGARALAESSARTRPRGRRGRK